MKKEDAVLVVSFGTSYNDSRKKTIEEIEKTIAGHFHGYEFHRAFTSRVIINILKKRDSISIDGVSEAMERLLNQGIKRVLVQPTHVMSGEEFDAMMEEMSPYEASFEAVAVGAPLLTSVEDYERRIRRNLTRRERRSFSWDTGQNMRRMRSMYALPRNLRNRDTAGTMSGLWRRRPRWKI